MKTRTEELMTVADCAREARVSYWTIRRRIAEDLLPAYEMKHGRGVRVKRSDWRDFLARELQPANARAAGCAAGKVN